MSSQIMTVVEVKIPVSQLKRGMFVCRLDKDWGESTFVFQGFLVNSDELIAKLQQECRYVYIDEAKGLSAKRGLADIPSKSSVKPKPQKTFFDKLLGRDKQGRKSTYKLIDIVEQKVFTKEIKPPLKLLEFDEEMPAAEQAHTVTGQMMKDFMTQIKRGGAIDILVAKRTVYDCISSILRTPDAMLLLMRLKNKDYSLWQHSVNVSVLAISLGRYLNLDDDDLMLLGLCGLFHDIGKLRIANDALAAAKTKQELQNILNSHTLLGQKILLASSLGQFAQVAAEAAFSHHEHLDGSGFPRGLKGAQISAYARMISIINVYDNLTTGKAGHPPITHYEAMKFLLENAGKYYDEALVDSFNRCVGTYPVGCVVEMSTGEIAVVVEEHEAQRLRPKILLLTDSEKNPISHKVIELAELEFSNEEESYFIKGIVKPEQYGIKLESLPQQFKKTSL